jgi:hypothetical protein
MSRYARLIGAGVCVGGVWGLAGVSLASDPWADRVVAYQAGDGVDAGYDDPTRALGSPTRVNFFGDTVTPFNTPYWSTELVSIGRGGSLTVAFDEAVLDDPLNPFGLDLLVFGNQFYVTNAAGRVVGLFGEGGAVELSADGEHWVLVTASAESGYAMNGYVDTVDLEFGSDRGTIPTDFTRPVDPAFDPFGRTRAEVVAGYAGSGGGLGIDIGAYGLSSVRYVRVSGADGGVEIDGFADVTAVPAPAGFAVLAAGLGGVAAVRRRRDR